MKFRHLFPHFERYRRKVESKMRDSGFSVKTTKGKDIKIY